MKQAVQIGALAIAVVLALASGIRIHAENQKKVPLGTDWSHRHMIYSALRNTANAEKVEREPRYQQQLLRRGSDNGRDGWMNPLRNEKRHQMTRDWSMLMGSGATLGAGNYAAKFAFDLNTEECGSDATPDYVAYNTSLPGSAGTTATGTVAFTLAPSAGDTVTIGLVTYTWQTSTGLCVGPCIIISTTGTDATRLREAVNDSGCTPTTCINITSANAAVTATSSGTSTILTSRTVGVPGNFTLSTSDPSSMDLSFAAGTNVAASVVAYDNLYSGCPSGTVPTTYWAYNTAGAANTSLTVSGDGTQVAFVQFDNVSGNEDLVILRWV